MKFMPRRSRFPAGLFLASGSATYSSRWCSAWAIGCPRSRSWIWSTPTSRARRGLSSPTWVPKRRRHLPAGGLVAKTAAIALVGGVMLTAAEIVAVIGQLWHGTIPDVPLLVAGIYANLGWSTLHLAMLAVAMRAILGHRWLSVATIVVLWTGTNLAFEHPLLRIGAPISPAPGMNGFGPFLVPQVAGGIYWTGVFHRSACPRSPGRRATIGPIRRGSAARLGAERLCTRLDLGGGICRHRRLDCRASGGRQPVNERGRWPRKRDANQRNRSIRASIST